MTDFQSGRLENWEKFFTEGGPFGDRKIEGFTGAVRKCDAKKF